MGALVAGVDVGTRSTKGVLVDSSNGRVVAHSAIAHGIDVRPGGGVEHDAWRVWWGGAREAFAQLAAAAPHGTRIGAVGLSSCGPCLVPVDADGRARRGGKLYGVDTRASAEVAELERAYGADATRLFGLPFSSQSAWAKLRWVETHEPAIAAAAASWLTANGFVALQLTGAHAIDHHQAAYFAPAYHAGKWSPAASQVSLPSLRWSSDEIGRVTSAAASQTGLDEGVPVVIGSSDGATDAIGAGITAGPTALVRYGSTVGLTIQVADAAITVDGLWRTPGNRAGETMLVGGLSTGGSITTWMREQFARELAQSDEAQIRSAHADLLAEAADSPSGSGGVITVPYFAGERTPFNDPGARGVIAGLSLSTTRGELYRSALEGTAYGLRQLLEAASAGGVPVTRLRAVGGGVATDLWVQIAADVTGIPHDIVDPHLGAPFGAARLAAESIGACSPGDPSWARVARTIEPRGSERALHDRRFPTMRRLYESTRTVIDELAEPGPRMT